MYQHFHYLNERVKGERSITNAKMTSGFTSHHVGKKLIINSKVGISKNRIASYAWICYAWKTFFLCILKYLFFILLFCETSFSVLKLSASCQPWGTALSSPLFLPCAAGSSVALLGEERDRKTSSSGSRKERRENNGPAEGAFVIPLSLNSLLKVGTLDPDICFWVSLQDWLP